MCFVCISFLSSRYAEIKTTEYAESLKHETHPDH